jgi:hypothetical protein
MKRATFISLIDVIGFIAFLFLTSSGILLYYLLPPGSGRWTQLWSLNRHDWGTLHLWLALLFFTLMALHLFTHWHFIVSLLRGRVKEGERLRTALGVLGLITVLLLAAAPLLSPVEVSAEYVGGRHQREGDEPPYRPSRPYQRQTTPATQ